MGVPHQRELLELHRHGAQSGDLDEVPGRRSRVERHRPVQLQRGRLPHPAAGALLHRPRQRDLLSPRIDTMKHTAKLLVLVAVGLTLAQAGCNDPLTVKLPDIIPPAALSDSAALATLRAGAIGDFDLAYTGDHPDGSGGNGEGEIPYGQPRTTTELLDTAIARFDSAIHIATVRDSADPVSQAALINFASVGKARALLFQGSGQYAAAAAVATTVPTDFVYQLQHTTTTDRENNGVFNAGATDGRYSISDSTPDDTFPGREGINGFPFLSVPDPRTPLLLDPVGSFDGATPLWDNLRYGGRASPITVATGVEARLIEAEAALAAGQTATFFTKLNNPNFRG